MFNLDARKGAISKTLAFAENLQKYEIGQVGSK